MAGVWHWMFFSCGFQHTKTVTKALDCDLGFVQCFIWDNTSTFYVHMIASNLL